MIKKITFLFILVLFHCLNSQLIITGNIDGPLTGGTPKAVELYVSSNIADLSIYGVGSANNGGGSDGEEFTFPTDAVSEGEYIYLATESIQFNNWFGFMPDYTDGSATNINGDDAIELFKNGSVIDVFGDINVDGSGKPWEHLDGWAYRVNGTGPDGSTFILSNWYFSGPNALDGESTNASASIPFPTGTYNDIPLPVTLTEFTAALFFNEYVSIIWVTQSESNMSHYNIFRDELIMGMRDATNTTTTTTYEFIDPYIEDGETYNYILEAIELDGTTHNYGPYTLTVDFGEDIEPPELPELTGLIGNYPNPFNPVTTIYFHVKENDTAVLNIYNTKGQSVHQKSFEEGTYHYKWDSEGLDSGVYLYKLDSSTYSQTKKMIILK